MKFQVIFQKNAASAHSPFHVVEQSTGQGVEWVNSYLDREHVRRLANTSLRIYAYILAPNEWAIHVPLGKLKTERMVPIDASVGELVQRLRFFRSLDPLRADGRLLARPSSKNALVRQLRDYLHQVCFSLGLSTRIVPHQFRHTYATEMLRGGVSFPVLMKLLGHTNPEMTMRYVDVSLTDLQREFHQARSHPKYLVPQPKALSLQLRAGLDGVVDSLLAAQHVLEIFRRPLPKGTTRTCLDRLSNRLTKILHVARNLRTP
jgi:hypothetical protein